MQNSSSVEIERFIREIEKLNEKDGGSFPRFVKPFHIASLAANCRANGIKLDIKHDCLDYAVRMGLFEAIGQAPPYKVNKYNQTGNLVEATPIINE
jgi:hypothetical protein